MSSVEERVWDALAEIEDPEMPVNLVDLGLVYGVRVDELGQASIDLTFTAMGCPASDFILEDVQARVGGVEGVRDVVVRVVWDPPWTADRLTEAGRDALESWGLAV